MLTTKDVRDRVEKAFDPDIIVKRRGGGPGDDKNFAGVAQSIGP